MFAEKTRGVGGEDFPKFQLLEKCLLVNSVVCCFSAFHESLASRDLFGGTERWQFEMVNWPDFFSPEMGHGTQSNYKTSGQANLSGWWLNQPHLKNMLVKLDHFPR